MHELHFLRIFILKRHAIFMKSRVNAEWPSSLVGVPPSGRRAHHDDVGQRRRRRVARNRRRLRCEHRVRRRGAKSDSERKYTYPT